MKIDFSFYEKWDYFETITNLFLLVLISISHSYGQTEWLQLIPAIAGLIFHNLRKNKFFWLATGIGQLYYLCTQWAICKSSASFGVQLHFLT